MEKAVQPSTAHTVLPYVDDAVPLRYLNTARHLVAVELHRSPLLLREAAATSTAQQRQLNAELSAWKEEMGLLAQQLHPSQVMPSPLSGTVRSLAAASAADDAQRALFEADCDAQCAVFPSVRLPHGSARVYSSPSSGEWAEARDSGGVNGHKRPRESIGESAVITATAFTEGVDEMEVEWMARRRTVSSSVGPKMDDAVYYESLLSQCENAERFTHLGELQSEEDAILYQLQHMQEDVIRTRRHIEDVNAARCLEQEECSRRTAELQVTLEKAAEKVHALEALLGVGKTTFSTNGVHSLRRRRSKQSFLLHLAD